MVTDVRIVRKTQKFDLSVFVGLFVFVVLLSCFNLCTLEEVLSAPLFSAL
jgi:hypothetical protein